MNRRGFPWCFSPLPCSLNKCKWTKLSPCHLPPSHTPVFFLSVCLWNAPIFSLTKEGKCHYGNKKAKFLKATSWGRSKVNKTESTIWVAATDEASTPPLHLVPPCPPNHPTLNVITRPPYTLPLTWLCICVQTCIFRKPASFVLKDRGWTLNECGSSHSWVCSVWVLVWYAPHITLIGLIHCNPTRHCYLTMMNVSLNELRHRSLRETEEEPGR